MILGGGSLATAVIHPPGVKRPFLGATSPGSLKSEGSILAHRSLQTRAMILLSELKLPLVGSIEHLGIIEPPAEVELAAIDL